MKVLTLHQPWASLVALGVKTIETRSWSTQYRGTLAIHAAARVPKGLAGPAGMIGRFTAHQDARSDGWYMLDSDWVGREHGSYQYPIPIPLGAIVATCTLVEVVPIIADGSDEHRDAGFTSYVLDRPGRLTFCDWLRFRDRPETGWGVGCKDAERYGGRHVHIEDQRPYGDFTAGRYAGLLADVVPIDPPVPFKGGQGLTKTWEP